MNSETEKKSGRPSSLRCLVTGGAGFIGSHITEVLLSAGHEVAVLDNLSTGKKEWIPGGVPFFCLDIRDDTDPAFREFQPNVVVHQAAQVSVPVSVREPEEDAAVNIVGSIHLLKTLRRHGVKKVVYASSSAGYGPVEPLPLREEMRPMPISPYGTSKLTVEHYLRVAARDWGLEWAALRYANVYGPRQDPHGEAGVVAIFTQKLLRGESPTIFDDGELTRDYVYVRDVATANLLAVEKNLAGHPDPVFNVSTGVQTSVNEIFREIRQSVETDVPAEYGPPRPGDVRHSGLDPAKAHKELGWQANTVLRDGLRSTTEFFKSRASLP